MKHLLLAIALFAVGCASTTGVVPLGPKTYSITEKRWNVVSRSHDTLKIDAYRKATEFCQAEGKTMVPCSTDSTTHRFELIFWALNPDDPRAQDPVPYTKPPTVNVRETGVHLHMEP